MNNRTEGNEASSIGVRANTEHGVTGDKIAGFDPAASPLETDAEAGGVPTQGGGAAQAAANGRLPTANGSAHANAMQAFETAEQPKTRSPFLVYVALVALALVVIIAVAGFIG
jgi:cobalamin biosynthesis Mg chelatase CobN